MAPDPRPRPAVRPAVLVAGSGAAGRTAALAAAASGARVVLAECSDELGGTTALSFGRVWVPASRHARGDTREAARAYLASLYGDRYPDLTRAFIAAAPEMARFVERRSPLRFVPCANYPDYHPSLRGASAGGRALDVAPVDLARLPALASSVRTPPGYIPLTHGEWERWRFPRHFDWALLDRRGADGVLTGGTALAAALLAGVVRAGVQVLTGTKLIRVRLGGDGAIIGATVRAADRVADVTASAVIIATGGFDRDPELRGRFLPAPVTATGAAPGNTGDGLRVAVEAGACLENTGQAWWMPMIKIPGQAIEGKQYYQSVIRERALPRQIMVNQAGRRFADEALPYNELGKVMNQRGPAGDYPNGTAWMLFDEGFRRRYSFPAARPGGPMPGWVVQAASVDTLARATGLDADTLAGTTDRWNSGCAAGRDAEFGRGVSAYERFMGDPSGPHPSLGPLDQPPFYAVRVLSGSIGTKGGPVTDADGRVLRAGSSPIGGLYAAGNAAAFWTADGYPGPGATLGGAMTMGYLAGRHAARWSRVAG